MPIDTPKGSFTQTGWNTSGYCSNGASREHTFQSNRRTLKRTSIPKHPGSIIESKKALIGVPEVAPGSQDNDAAIAGLPN
jgi:hypothetical protein